MAIDDLRLQPKMTTALEVAVLVKTLPLDLGADLIEQYARTMAAEAKIDATNAVYDRLQITLNGTG